MRDIVVVRFDERPRWKSYSLNGCCCLKKDQNAPRPSEAAVVAVSQIQRINCADGGQPRCLWSAEQEKEEKRESLEEHPPTLLGWYGGKKLPDPKPKTSTSIINKQLSYTIYIYLYHFRFLFVWRVRSRTFFPVRLVFFLPCDHGLDFLHQLVM